MTMERPKPILVTGSHRSGTTWTGRMLAAAPGIGYIWEPFNPLHRPGTCAARFDRWFMSIDGNNEQRFLKALRDTSAFRYNYRAELGTISSAKDLKRMARDAVKFALYRCQKRRPLVKDPIALLSAEWLARRFDMTVVVLIRHPAAFTSSIVRYSMRHPFGDFLAQPELMNGLLSPFRDQIRDYAHTEHELVDQGILLWNICHHAILRYQKTQPKWMFLRHEDLASRPVARFRDVYRTLDLQFTENARKTIKHYSSSNNPGEVKENRPGRIRRNSRATILNWHQRLSTEQIARVRKGTEALAPMFYDEDSWEPADQIASVQDAGRVEV